MKIAILANRSAGGRKAGGMLQTLREKWSSHQLIGAAGFGGEFLPECRNAETPDKEYLAALRQAVTILLAEKPDLLVTVGGDGTAAYAAEELLRQQGKS